MTYLSGNFARILTALGILLFFAGPLRADPVVKLSPLGEFGIPIMNIGVPTFLGQTSNFGNFTVVITNASNFTFQDFHFFTPNDQVAPWVGNVNLVFSDFTSTRSRIDFVIGGAGFGVGPNESFTATFTGFSANTQIRGTATIPEPTTLLLLGTGMAGVAFKVRKRFKNRKSK